MRPPKRISRIVIYHLSIATGVICYNIGSRNDFKSDYSYVDQYSRPYSYQNCDNPSQYQYFQGSYPSNGLSQSSGDYYRDRSHNSYSSNLTPYSTYGKHYSPAASSHSSHYHSSYSGNSSPYQEIGHTLNGQTSSGVSEQNYLPYNDPSFSSSYPSSYDSSYPSLHFSSYPSPYSYSHLSSYSSSRPSSYSSTYPSSYSSSYPSSYSASYPSSYSSSYPSSYSSSYPSSYSASYPSSYSSSYPYSYSASYPSSYSYAHPSSPYSSYPSSYQSLYSSSYPSHSSEGIYGSKSGYDESNTRHERNYSSLGNKKSTHDFNQYTGY